jgi:hypothetical protein
VTHRKDRRRHPVADAAGYIDALRTRSSNMTIIEPTPTPTQPTKGRRRAIILAAAAAAVVGAVVLASCDDDSTAPITNQAPATSQPPPTTGGAQGTVDDTAADVAQPVVEAASAEPVSPPPPEAFEACLPGNSGPGPDFTTEELSIPTPAGEIRLVRERGEIYEGVLRSDDPRFQGTHYFSYETDIYTLPDGREIAIRHYHNRIETADGVWQGSPGPIILDAVNNVPDLALTGEGAYEGLMALATWLSVNEADPNLQPTDPSCNMQFTGYVVSVF